MDGKRLATTVAQLAVTGVAIALNAPTVHAGVGDLGGNLLGGGLAIRAPYQPSPRRGRLGPVPIYIVKGFGRGLVGVSPPVLGGFGTGKSVLVRTLRAGGLKPYAVMGEAPAFMIVDPAGELRITVIVIELWNRRYNLLSMLPPERVVGWFVDKALPNIVPLQPTQASILHRGLNPMLQYCGVWGDATHTWRDELAKCRVQQLYGHVVWRRSSFAVMLYIMDLVVSRGVW